MRIPILTNEEELNTQSEAVAHTYVARNDHANRVPMVWLQCAPILFVCQHDLARWVHSRHVVHAGAIGAVCTLLSMAVHFNAQ